MGDIQHTLKEQVELKEKVAGRKRLDASRLQSRNASASTLGAKKSLSRYIAYVTCSVSMAHLCHVGSSYIFTMRDRGRERRREGEREGGRWRKRERGNERERKRKREMEGESKREQAKEREKVLTKLSWYCWQNW